MPITCRDYYKALNAVFTATAGGNLENLSLTYAAKPTDLAHWTFRADNIDDDVFDFSKHTALTSLHVLLMPRVRSPPPNLRTLLIDLCTAQTLYGAVTTLPSLIAISISYYAHLSDAVVIDESFRHEKLLMFKVINPGIYPVSTLNILSQCPDLRTLVLSGSKFQATKYLHTSHTHNVAFFLFLMAFFCLFRNSMCNLLRQLPRLTCLVLKTEIEMDLPLNSHIYCDALRSTPPIDSIITMPNLTLLRVELASSGFIEAVVTMLRCPILDDLHITSSLDWTEKSNLGPLLESCQRTLIVCTLRCDFVTIDNSKNVNEDKDEDEDEDRYEKKNKSTSSELHLPNLMMLDLLIAGAGDMAELHIPSCAPNLRNLSLSAKTWSVDIVRMLCIALPPTLGVLELSHPGDVKPDWSHDELCCLATLRHMLPRIERRDIRLQESLFAPLSHV